MIVSYLPDFLSGAWLTLEIGLVSLSLGTALGLLLSLTRRSPHRLLSWPSYVYIEFFRTTPPLIQIVWLYYGLPLLLGFDLGAFGAAALALGLNIAAFFAEIFRAGIAAVDRTQWQAAQMLGLGRTDTFRFVILPQALRNVLPPMGTTVIYLIKDTALASAIGTPELLRIGQLVANETFLPVEALTIVAVIYFLVTYPIAFGFHALERRLSTTRA
jgi:polar amino acid transport system permease protein